MSEGKLLEVKNLTVTYGSNKVIRNIDFNLDYGEVLSIVGPSGSGKSTILHAIAGLIDLETSTIEGQIILYGKDISKTPPEDRNILLLFQGLALFPHMSCYENIAFPLKTKKIYSNKEVKDKIARICEIVNLNPHLLEKLPKNISGGEKQRVALARALVGLKKDGKSNILLLDEPFSSLDAHLMFELLAEIKRLKEEFNLGIIYVTHSKEEALRVSNRIAIISNGIVHQIGIPTNIYNHPQSSFVARFLGMDNIFSATIKSTDLNEIEIQLNKSDLNLISTNFQNDYFNIDEKVEIILNPKSIYWKKKNSEMSPSDSNNTKNSIHSNLKQINFIGDYWEAIYLSQGLEFRSKVSDINLLPEINEDVLLTFDKHSVIIIKKK